MGPSLVCSLARLLASLSHSLAPHYSLRSAALIRSLAQRMLKLIFLDEGGGGEMEMRCEWIFRCVLASL